MPALQTEDDVVQRKSFTARPPRVKLACCAARKASRFKGKTKSSHQVQKGVTEMDALVIVLLVLILLAVTGHLRL